MTSGTTSWKTGLASDASRNECCKHAKEQLLRGDEVTGGRTVSGAAGKLTAKVTNFLTRLIFRFGKNPFLCQRNGAKAMGFAKHRFLWIFSSSQHCDAFFVVDCRRSQTIHTQYRITKLSLLLNNLFP